MCLLLGNVEVDHSYHEDNSKEDESRRTCTTLAVTCDSIVNESYDGVKSACIACRTHIVTKDTDDGGIFLKSADKAGDDNVCKHRRKKRNCDTGKHTYPASTVDLSRIVILLVYTLKTAKKNEDLEGERIPNNVNNENR